MSDKRNIIDVLKDMKDPLSENRYFAITITANSDGELQLSTQTSFAGVSEDKPHREIKTACEVLPLKMLELWASLKMPGIVVNNLSDLLIFTLVGGNAVVEESICRKYFSEIFERKEVARTGLVTSDFLDAIEQDHLRRAPKPKLRMRILKRDNYRCRICGRSSADNTDIVLHVHHFIPAEIGGLSNEANLVTLCHTCHGGLDPHFDMQLANIFQETFSELNAYLDDDSLGEYREGVANFRRIMKEKREARESAID